MGLFPGVVPEGSLSILQSQYDALDMALQKDSKYYFCQCQSVLKTQAFLLFSLEYILQGLNS